LKELASISEESEVAMAATLQWASELASYFDWRVRSASTIDKAVAAIHGDFN